MNRRSIAFDALGTTAMVTVTDPAHLRAAGALLHDELALIDRACSTFRADSELNAVNAGAGSTVGVSRLLFEAVEAAIRAARATDGAVDPTVGGAVRAIALESTYVVRLRRVAVWRRVVLDPDRTTIRLPHGVALDLGATGTAFAADRAARRIANETSTGVLVTLGGDIAMAGDAPPGGWPVRVEGGTTIALRVGGLATSSTTAPGSWRTASVAAASCVDANTASTAAIVLGDAAPAWLERTGLAARLVSSDGDVVGIAGWPRD